ncbi:MAG: DUF2399 domain-containing protein [Acidimicrobiia bacterium]
MTCELCDGSCAGANLDGLAAPELAWLWHALADAADRRGDARMVDGSATFDAPVSTGERAAAAGLLGRRHIAPGQRLRVDLGLLAARLAPLTPGAAAAHGAHRRLARRAEARAARAGAEAAVRARISELVPRAAEDEAWTALRRSGWVARVVEAGDDMLVGRAAAVLAHLPAHGDPPVDRRVLAQAAAGDPHALDRGQQVGGLALGILAASGRVPPGLTAREAWTSVGVAYDDIVGGLTCLGVVPRGWQVPPDSVLTLPPRTLARCVWPPGGEVVFVTENPSVLSAAVGIPGARVICTSGTPSAVEVAALVLLARGGWRLAVRADFDVAGLHHADVILAATPDARPWRFRAVDYRQALATARSPVGLRVDRIPPTPWDPELSAAMIAEGVAVFEEALLDVLVDDIRASAPSERVPRAPFGGEPSECDP